MLFAVTAALPVTLMAEDESDIALAEGSGRIQVQAACSMCHSLDYIVMNSHFQDKTAWEKTVKKMVAVMGAPIAADDLVIIVGYLEAHYGKLPPAVAER
ncbi:MAG: cytochrome c [Burkholderiales bacterium]